MMQNGKIFLRQESLRRYLWERIEESRLNRNSETMTRALAYYDFERDLEASLDRMTEVETESVVLHELGEALAGEQLGEAWHVRRAISLPIAFRPCRASSKAATIRPCIFTSPASAACAAIFFRRP